MKIFLMYVLRFKIKAKIITFNGWMGILVKQEVEVFPFEIKKKQYFKKCIRLDVLYIMHSESKI